MSRVLFISNGHGETAIAECIARELALRIPSALEHLPLVAAGDRRILAQVGPRAVMPSGGLVAMGNVRAFSRDLRAGFLGLFADQVSFLRHYGSAYSAVVAVGDLYALGMALFTGRPIVFTGTAKSVHVAGYGPFERVLMRRASRAFVRDEPTARLLRRQGVSAEAPGNVIVDLLEEAAQPARRGVWIGVLPGSRPPAYEAGVRLASVVRALSARALFSVASGLDPEVFSRMLAADGWTIARTPEDPFSPFEARDASGGALLTAWRGSLGALLGASHIVLGQAGTANEAAAALGIPVVALETDHGGWYRMRQQRLLGEALVCVPEEPHAAAEALRALLADERRLQHMRMVGRERMGPPGGARAIADAIVEVCTAR